MKKRWREFGIIVLAFTLWRLSLVIIEQTSPVLWPLRLGFLGKTPWANFDGVHYLSIAHAGYRQYLEAFFPFYPAIIKFTVDILRQSGEVGALLLSHAALLGALVFFWELAKKEKRVNPIWSVIFLLAYPVSFFFAAAYTTSLYFLLAASTLYFMKKKRWFMAGASGALASATQLFGVFLLLAVGLEYFQEKKRRLRDLFGVLMIPSGLVMYMIYLGKSMGDALAFYHVQPLFGAERSASHLVLLPQVLWRYIKIFTLSSWDTTQYWVAAFEFSVFLLALWLLWRGLKEKLSSSYLLYSLTVILLPTLTGTFSSLPRYLLSAFPLFFVLGTTTNRLTRIFLTGLFTVGLIIACSLFLRGYFVS
ncbi:hypothetical protein HY086_02080 [Candidatus Gottesmanbacteria bacterium]|nr:hypothetical protein [Candidatus Gottesmanbacteria bacterium]